jgi:phage tail-like protein
MPAPRPYALLRTADQWRRAAYTDAALVHDTILLAWKNPDAGEPAETPASPALAGLAFDRHCRLYHSLPEGGMVERVLWAAEVSLSFAASPHPSRLLFGELADPVAGEFSTPGLDPLPLRFPTALAVDADDRLFIAESGARRVLVFDLFGERLMREIPLGLEPLDLAASGRTVMLVARAANGAPRLLRLNARAEPVLVPWPAGTGAAARIAASPSGQFYLLESGGSASARIVRASDGIEIVPSATAKFARDLEFQPADSLTAGPCPAPGEILVLARNPGASFLRICLAGDSEIIPFPLQARGYDGRGIVRTPDGRIGFWSAGGQFQHAVAARVRYTTEGSVTTFRLDSGDFQTEWGRIFLDACVPSETSVAVRCAATDEPPEDEAMLARTPPANLASSPAALVKHEELSPPTPPLSIADALKGMDSRKLHRRETGREIPWLRMGEGDHFETFEAPVEAVGRYLWVRIDLSGNSISTPRVRALRAEYPTHDYLRKLPKLFSRDPADASFLNRYLAMLEGLLGELEAKADARELLLDPRSAPAEILPWLADFLGLVLDERMARARRPGGGTVDVRRDLIRASAFLFRFRGTIAGLRRYLQVYLAVEPIVIEKFRVRGLGAGVLGAGEGLISNSVLGGGFRVGGAVDGQEANLRDEEPEDAFRTHAHRFTVTLPAVLLDEEMDLVRQILEVHRPAHTLVEICTVGGGLRVGLGSHVGLSAFVGKSGGFSPAQLGRSSLGRGAIIGRPAAGTFPSASRVEIDTHVG